MYVAWARAMIVLWSIVNLIAANAAAIAAMLLVRRGAPVTSSV